MGAWDDTSDEHHEDDGCEVFDSGDRVWRRDDGGGGRTEVAVEDLEPGEELAEGSFDWDVAWQRVDDVHVTADGTVHVRLEAD